MRICLMFFLLTFLSSCAQLVSVSQTSVPKRRGRIVETLKQKWIWGSMQFNNSFVYNIREDLIQQCPQGRVQGILTTTEKIVYVPFIVERVRVNAQGFCNER